MGWWEWTGSGRTESSGVFGATDKEFVGLWRKGKGEDGCLPNSNPYPNKPPIPYSRLPPSVLTPPPRTYPVNPWSFTSKVAGRSSVSTDTVDGSLQRGTGSFLRTRGTEPGRPCTPGPSRLRVLRLGRSLGTSSTRIFNSCPEDHRGCRVRSERHDPSCPDLLRKLPHRNSGH